MTQPIVTKAEIPGRCLEPGTQETYLIRECVHLVSVAGTLRRSSLPDEALQLLRGVYPVLIKVIHRRFIWNSQSITTGARLEELIAAGHISQDRFALLQKANADASEMGTSRDLTHLLTGAVALVQVIRSDAFRTAETPVKPTQNDPAKSAKRGLLGRLATAASGLMAFGS